MLKEIIGLAMATVVGTTLLSQMPSLDSEVDGAQLRAMLGVSEQVQDCAANVLAGKDEDQLLETIRFAVNGGEDATTLALRECVAQDPFGWAGTENEFALSLLKGNN